MAVLFCQVEHVVVGDGLDVVVSLIFRQVQIGVDEKLVVDDFCGVLEWLGEVCDVALIFGIQRVARLAGDAYRVCLTGFAVVLAGDARRGRCIRVEAIRADALAVLNLSASEAAEAVVRAWSTASSAGRVTVDAAQRSQVKSVVAIAEAAAVDYGVSNARGAGVGRSTG